MNTHDGTTPGIVYGKYIPILGKWKTPEERIDWYKMDYKQYKFIIDLLDQQNVKNEKNFRTL